MQVPGLHKRGFIQFLFSHECPKEEWLALRGKPRQGPKTACAVCVHACVPSEDDSDQLSLAQSPGGLWEGTLASHPPPLTS